MEFQAKDIEKMLGITKSRYDYLAWKMGIRPELEEAEGVGQRHLYSLKNVLQFAFAHHASTLGLTPKATRELLEFLNKHHTYPKQHLPDDNEEKTGIFDVRPTFLRLHYFPSEKGVVFCLSGENPNSEFLKEMFDTTFDNLPGYITINLGAIKNQVLEYVAERK